MFYLKCWPVHGHPWAMIIAEPPQVFLCAYGLNRALQFSVYCDIAEERRAEQAVTMEGPEGTWGCCQTGIRTHTVAQIPDWKRSKVRAWVDFLSLNSLPKLEPPTAKVFSLNNSFCVSINFPCKNVICNVCKTIYTALTFSQFVTVQQQAWKFSMMDQHKGPHVCEVKGKWYMFWKIRKHLKNVVCGCIQ